MQIIEQTGFGVRSAILTFESRQHPGVRFVVIPMLHLGTPAFYRSVRGRLVTCDRIVVEGVGGRTVSALTLAYRTAGRLRRGGLVTQHRGLDLSDLSDRVVRPDLTAAQFAAGWKRIGRTLRWLIVLAAPLLGLSMLIVGPRRMLGRELGLDDLPSNQEEEEAEIAPEIDEALLGDRDRALTHALLTLAREPGPLTVGVCWGAAHVRAITRALRANGYRITDANWVTVFS